MNKRGVIHANIVVFLILALVLFTLFSFATNGSEVKDTILDSFYVNKLHTIENNLERDLYEDTVSVVLLNYRDAIETEDETLFRKVLMDSLIEEFKQDEIKELNVTYKDEILINLEKKEPIIGKYKKGEGYWVWVDSFTEDDYIGVIYRPKLEAIVDLKDIGLLDFNDLNSYINKCKNEERIEKCLNDEIKEFNVDYDSDTGIASFESKRYFFINRELRSISFQIKLTQDL